MKNYIGGQRNLHSELLTDTTITLNNSMSVSEIQARINQFPKILRADLTFQFSDGTYTPADGSSLVFDSFTGSGTVKVQGNTGESGLHTNQAVIVNLPSTHQAIGFYFRSCTCPIILQNIRVDRSAPAGLFYVSVQANFCSDIMIRQCCFDCDSISCYGVAGYFSKCEAYYNYVGSHSIFLLADSCSEIIAHDNLEISGTDRPQYAWWATRASSFGSYGTLPSDIGSPTRHEGSRQWV